MHPAVIDNEGPTAGPADGRRRTRWPAARLRTGLLAVAELLILGVRAGPVVLAPPAARGSSNCAATGPVFAGAMPGGLSRSGGSFSVN